MSKNSVKANIEALKEWLPTTKFKKKRKKRRTKTGI